MKGSIKMGVGEKTVGRERHKPWSNFMQWNTTISSLYQYMYMYYSAYITVYNYWYQFSFMYRQKYVPIITIYQCQKWI